MYGTIDGRHPAARFRATVRLPTHVAHDRHQGALHFEAFDYCW